MLEITASPLKMLRVPTPASVNCPSITLLTLSGKSTRMSWALALSRYSNSPFSKAVVPSTLTVPPPNAAVRPSILPRPSWKWIRPRT